MLNERKLPSLNALMHVSRVVPEPECIRSPKNIMNVWGFPDKSLLDKYTAGRKKRASPEYPGRIIKKEYLPGCVILYLACGTPEKPHTKRVAKNRVPAGWTKCTHEDCQ